MSSKLKSYPAAIFILTTNKTRQIMLQMPSLASLQEIWKKKKSLELKILRFFIVCRFFLVQSRSFKSQHLSWAPLLYWILIFSFYILLQLCQSWDNIEMAWLNKGLHKATLAAMKLKETNLQKFDKQAQKIRIEGLSEGCKEINKVIYYRGISFVPIMIWIKLIICHQNKPLEGHLYTDKTRELICQKYN